MAQVLAVGPEERVGDSNAATRWLARVGLFMVSLDCEDPEPKEVMSRIQKALQADPRVDHLSGGEPDEKWTSNSVVYPAGPREAENTSGILDGSDHRHVFSVPNEFTFVVRVPSKNQPVVMQGERVPEQYTVKWNGTVASVFWLETRQYPAFSAGHVIREVLAEVTAAAGFGFYTQPCSSDCSFPFLHRTTVLTTEPGRTDGIRFEAGAEWDEVIGRGPEGSDNEELSDLFYSTIAFDSRTFAYVKNVGSRILDLESVAREALGSLLELQYRHTRVRGHGTREYLRRRWALRGWRAESRELVSKVWLAVTNLEALHRRWARMRSKFEAGTREDGTLLLFEGDHFHDAQYVSTVDVGGLATAVQQASSRLDTMALASATTWGALAGGATGAAVSGLMQLL